MVVKIVDDCTVQHKKASSLGKGIFSKKKKKILLRHRHLGHLSFSYLRRLFSSLFCERNFSYFVCETCVMAKSHHTTFHLSDSKSNFSFSLVQSGCLGMNT